MEGQATSIVIHEAERIDLKNCIAKYEVKLIADQAIHLEHSVILLFLLPCLKGNLVHSGMLHGIIQAP